MSVAQHLVQGHRSRTDVRVAPDPSDHDTDPVTDAETYARALSEMGPCGYGAVARHLGWGATRAGQAADVLRLAGRVIYDRTGRGRLVDHE